MIIEEVENEGTGVTVLAIKGDFWGGGEWELHERVKNLIELEKSNVVIDLSKIARVNSQGIGILVSCLTSLRNVGGNMKIAGANSNISSHLELLNLYTVVESYPSAESAVESFTTA